MNLRRFWPAWAALLLGACTGPPAAEAPTAPPEPVVLAVPDEKDSKDGSAMGAESPDDAALFLWIVTGEEDEPRTYWVESAEGKVAERGVVDGAVLAAAGQVWQWKTESEAVATAPCGGLGPRGSASSRGQAQRAWFEPVGGTGPRQVVNDPTRSSQLSSQLSGFAEWLHPVGSAGAFVFIRLHQEACACGAVHCGYDAPVFIWDVGRGERAQVDLGDFDSPELREAAFAQLREHGLYEHDKPSWLQLYGLLPIYDQRGRLRLGRVYQTFTCSPCSEGDEDYFRRTTVPGPPPRWEGVRARAPELVAAFLRHRPWKTLRGWSRAPRFDAAPAPVRQLFAAASHTSQERAR